jgi:uncharacterized heparinase superfamily protein
MADRGINRIVAKPAIWQVAQSCLQSMSKRKPVASGFRQILTRIEDVDQSPAFLMYAGHFDLAGFKHCCTVQNLFKIKGREAWRSQLVELGWLKYFVASNRKLHSFYAMELLQAWSKAKLYNASLSTIVLNLAIDGPALFKSSEASVAQPFLKIVTSYVNRLHQSPTVNPVASFNKAIALLSACAGFHGFEPYLKSATDLLVTSIDKVISPDGGPISRNPSDLLEILTKILPLRIALKATHQTWPQSADQAVARIYPMLNMMLHGDGGINADAEQIKLIKQVLCFDDVAAPCPHFAPYTGFARLTGAKTCIVVDTKLGLDFEFSEGTQRILRVKSQTDISPSEAEFQILSQGSLLHINKNEHRQRRYFLSSDGKDFRIEDQSTSSFEIQFAIDPSIKITTLRENAGIMLVTPTQSVWQLSLRGGEAHLEQNGAVLKIRSTSSRVNWALKKQAPRNKHHGRKSGRPHNESLL